MSARITTVIPTFRRPRLVVRAIGSVLAQNYNNCEVHVYDNASGDETTEVISSLARHDSRIRYHTHPRNIGMMENFAYGIDHVETPLFNILSDDDILLPGFFEMATAALGRNSQAALFIGGLLFADDRGVVVKAPVEEWRTEGLVRPPTLFELIAPGAWLTWTSMLFRTEALRAIGGLKTFIGHTADVDLILRALIHYPAVVKKKPCAVFTVHSGSASVVDRLLVHETHLNFSGLASIEHAIELAELGKAIDAATNRRVCGVLRARVERDLFQKALAFISEGQSAIALLTADALDDKLKRRDLATIIRLAANDGVLARISRASLRLMRKVRHKSLTAGNSRCYRRHSALVAETLSRLSAPSTPTSLPRKVEA